MVAVAGTLLVLGILSLICLALVRADPARLAAALRMSGPVILGAAGLMIIVIGQPAIGGAGLVSALLWRLWMRKSSPRPPVSKRRSTVRTAAIEMELDHATGSLEGLVLAGRQEGETLGSMSLSDLLSLYREVSDDPESRQLLEAYLDGRFPVWRKHANSHRRRGQGGAPRPGAMTKEEAYKVLGLEAGAAATDIRKAHRRLMQRLNSDVGGTSVLAARINQAKDVLLSSHE